MNAMPLASPMDSSVIVVTPHNGYPVMSGVMSQVPLYPNSQPQVHFVPENPPGLMSAVNVLPAQKILKEGKVLGVMQILIGLVHMGLGAIMATVLLGNYEAVSFYGGFPFWGGIWFIISGSISMAAETQRNSSCLLSSSVGLNIFSAIFSAIGITLLITDLGLTSTYSDFSYYPPHWSWDVSAGVAISSVLLIFCVLELCVACVASHFGCRVVCCRYSHVDAILPNMYPANPVAIPQPPNTTPSYSHGVQYPS
ncbi:membrane-spanning 4-domains subfamily A member 8-like [Perognathus longimembris pacificus]|uniref:membrane-spanning 4-domains subfamily A member 8-like n=1 Tax=Perognathus longimembris pacificus TaxID=214514 RepID=UPI0020197EA5|nr:membrane-spanning 4-domains subfamily A member 8-like [Perognathus longimembris pacificus]